MLEFVNVSGPSGSKDLQTRRKVRSQAMRDFRRRQREEREALKANKTPLPSPSWPARERAASTGSESTQRSSRRQSVRSTSPRIVHLSSQKEGERTFQATQKHEQSRTSQNITNQEAVKQWQYDMGPMTSNSGVQSQYWQPYTSRDPSPSLLQEPSTWGTETEDPFESPAQLQQMLGFCRSYIHWLRPGVETETAGKILGQAWETRPCPMLLAACCLASVGHLDAVQPNRPGGNYEVYKARVLRDVSKRMKSPATAISEETLGALACLLSFEMSRGSEEALTHLRGLESMTKVRGGVGRLEMGTLPTMLQKLDLLHAVLFDCQPILINAKAHTSMFASPEDIDPDPHGLPKLLSSIAVEQEYFSEYGPASHTEALRPLQAIIRESGLLLRDGIDEETGATSHAHGSIERYREALDDFIGGNDVEETEPDAFELVRCTHSMALIAFNLIAERIPFRHAANQHNTGTLFDAVRRIKNRTWEVLPYLRILILLTGAASTTNSGTKSFFKAELIRSMYQMGAEEEQRIETFILRFIKMKDVLQQPDGLSTPAIDPHQTSDFLPPSRAIRQDYFGVYDKRPVNVMRSTSYTDWSTKLPVPSYPASAPLEQIHQTTPFDEDKLDPFLEYHEFSR